MPERAPPGQLPRAVDVLLESDLVDRCKPGDRVQVVGIYRALPSKHNSSGMFNTLLIANHIRPCTKELASDTFTREDVVNIKVPSPPTPIPSPSLFLSPCVPDARGTQPQLLSAEHTARGAC